MLCKKNCKYSPRISDVDKMKSTDWMPLFTMEAKFCQIIMLIWSAGRAVGSTVAIESSFIFITASLWTNVGVVLHNAVFYGIRRYTLLN